MIKNFLISFFLFIKPSDIKENYLNYYSPIYEQKIERTSPLGLKESYKSSVIVFSSKGENIVGTGSGNYFRFEDKFFILTAAHVVSSGDRSFVGEKSSGLTEVFVSYINEEKDIAILQPLKRLEFTKPVKFKKSKDLKIGQNIYHTGHPDAEVWHLSEGLLSGVYTDFIIANTFAWPGSSGSIVFDKSGHVIGIVSSIKMSGPLGYPDMIEHIVMLSNINSIDIEKILDLL